MVDMEPEAPVEQLAWLQSLNDAGVLSRTLISSWPFLIGRRTECSLVVEGGEASYVSGQHCRIERLAEGYRLLDSESRNGTLLNGETMAEAWLQSGDLIQLGKGGPRFRFLLLDLGAGEQGGGEPSETLVLRGKKGQPGQQVVEQGGAPGGKRENGRATGLVQVAVARARAARDHSQSGQTHILMADVVRTLINRHHRKHRLTLVLAALLLLGVSLGSYLAMQRAKNAKEAIDSELGSLERRLEQARDPAEIESLIGAISQWQHKALAIQRSLLYELGMRDEESDFVESELKRVLQDFGAHEYSIPPEFLQRVKHHIQRFRSADRAGMQKALAGVGDLKKPMQKLLKEKGLPEDLLFMTLVESGNDAEARSGAGAVGLWQFLPATARAYGLKVDEEQDQRRDPLLATGAAARYMRDLILEFGSGSSVMLALAAYNVGPSRVKSAIRKVQDPIRQRDFWYLYRVRALPQETREYVPRIMAAIVIGRVPQRFGFAEPRG
jgi:hypothetical protein